MTPTDIGAARPSCAYSHRPSPPTRRTRRGPPQGLLAHHPPASAQAVLERPPEALRHERHRPREALAPTLAEGLALADTGVRVNVALECHQPRRAHGHLPVRPSVLGVESLPQPPDPQREVAGVHRGLGSEGAASSRRVELPLKCPNSQSVMSHYPSPRIPFSPGVRGLSSFRAQAVQGLPDCLIKSRLRTSSATLSTRSLEGAIRHPFRTSSARSVAPGSTTSPSAR